MWSGVSSFLASFAHCWVLCKRTVRHCGRNYSLCAQKATPTALVFLQAVLARVAGRTVLRRRCEGLGYRRPTLFYGPIWFAALISYGVLLRAVTSRRVALPSGTDGVASSAFQAPGGMQPEQQTARGTMGQAQS